MNNRTLTIILGFLVVVVLTASPVAILVSVRSTNNFIHKAGETQSANTCRDRVSQDMQEEFQVQVIGLITGDAANDEGGIAKIIEDLKHRKSFVERVKIRCGPDVAADLQKKEN